jgi:hypothetical protein
VLRAKVGQRRVITPKAAPLLTRVERPFSFSSGPSGVAASDGQAVVTLQ